HSWGLGVGSAGGATAIPSSQPRCWARRCACRVGAHAVFILTSFMSSALSCRSATASSASHQRRAELALSNTIGGVSLELRELAGRPPDRSPHRREEPYRLAISGIYARVAATARLLSLFVAERRPAGEAPPYRNPAEFRDELRILDKSLSENGSRVLARGRLRSLRRAIDCFGFHLASVDLRQNSDVHD